MAGGKPISIEDLQRELEVEMASNSVIVRLGDASIASPFTCRQSSIYPTIKVIQQGRCTLVTMLQIYKIQALTCLSLAYSLSALYVDGVKLGDSQMTLSGIFSAILFLVMSHAKPLKTLAPTRPPATILCFYVFLTVAGQFAVHMYTLWASINLTRPHTVPGWVCSPGSTNSTLAKEVSLRAPTTTLSTPLTGEGGIRPTICGPCVWHFSTCETPHSPRCEKAFALDRSIDSPIDGLIDRLIDGLIDRWID